jgi:hypothetical protein
MICSISRFYICTDADECEGFVADISTDEADTYEEKLKAADSDYLRVDL